MSTVLGIVLLGFSLLFFAAPSMIKSGRLGPPPSAGKQVGLFLLLYLLAAIAFGLGLGFLVL